ncbi:MAG: HAMP domain-containing histidine kinase [Thiobacillus sp.]|nr:HAMP domain-containing histidine kinase [Thiobacillus sp.]
MHSVEETQWPVAAAGETRWPWRWHKPSLLASLLWLLGGVVACVSLVAYFSIEYFIDRQFAALHQQRVQRLEAQAVTALGEERRYLDSLAALVASDSELGNSTYYHLYLEGERRLPQSAVARLARTFGLAAIVLATPQGRTIARQGAPLPSLGGDGVRIVWWRGEAWLVASRPVRRATLHIARIEIGQPLSARLNARLAVDVESLRLYPAPVPGMAALKLADNAWLVARVANPAQAALVEVRRLLLVILAAAGLALVTLTGWVLRRRLRPLRDLALATERVGRGEFALRLDTDEGNEIGRLVEAFNSMTAQLGQAREIEARMEHEARLSAIGRVAARVAHDINNPLTVISNAAQLMARELAADSPLQADVQMIRHHSARASETVRQLLEFGRTVRPRRHEFDADAWLEDWVSRWNRRGRYADSMRYRPLGRPVAVCLDSLLLEQMLDNLATNACQAGQPVTIRLEDDRESILIEVIDSGPGFSEADRQHLFEPFYTTKPEGTGLGLASALTIARAHGGDIEALAGRPGRIRVRLPRAQASVCGA